MMKTFLTGLMALSLTCGGALAQASHKHATCTGSATCKACKNCHSCKHCKKDGGTCGACKKTSQAAHKDASPTSRTGSRTKAK